MSDQPTRFPPVSSNDKDGEIQKGPPVSEKTKEANRQGLQQHQAAMDRKQQTGGGVAQNLDHEAKHK